VQQLKVDFNRPVLTGNELKYIQEAIEGGHLSGDGPFTQRCNSLLEKALGVPRALLTTSCTHALEMAAMLLEIQPGDEVIVPAFTFVSTVNAFVLRGAKPVFVDIRADTLNLDEARLDGAFSARTKAVVPVHYAGVGCEMDQIAAAAASRGVKIVEDNAHGLFGKYRDRFLGTLGSLAAQSFHETKNFTSGEGGALIINDPELIERAEIIREKGTDRSRFFRGQIDKYTWVDVGSSYLPSDLLAAFLLAQLEQREKVQHRREQIWGLYEAGLSEWAAGHDVRMPYVPPHCEQTFHMFYLRMPTLESRQGLIHHLRERGIYAVFHYLPLHLSAMGQSFGGRVGDCPVTELVSDQLVRLPFHNALSSADQELVIEAIQEFKF